MMETLLEVCVCVCDSQNEFGVERGEFTVRTHSPVLFEHVTTLATVDMETQTFSEVFQTVSHCFTIG
jgi:hypothetical protein